jgi:SAM-dependent methyltransferase
MKTRESGMPAEDLWSSFFSPHDLLIRLGCDARRRDVLDVGSGYGTFSLPAARLVKGTVHAVDVDSALVTVLADRARTAGLANVVAVQRDVVNNGFGLADASVDYVMLFNLLHAENPLHLTREAFRVLSPGGAVGVIHWIHDPATPRGPSLDIRPTPGQCRSWLEQSGFVVGPDLSLPPWHYGLVGEKTDPG